jgi:hypothetical protein
MIFFSLWGLTGDYNTLSYGTIFGDVPTWFIFWFAFLIISPITSFVIFTMFPKKYDREFKKRLIPYRNNIPLHYPVKFDGEEPEWYEPKEFYAKLELNGISGIYASHRYCFAGLKDVNTGIEYLMFADRFNNLEANEEGLYEGTFNFDTKWKITNIYEVK